MKEIWWDKHRPKTLSEFVGQDQLKGEFGRILDTGQGMQHYIFHSREAGTGKTSLAYIIADTLGYQLHQFNASTREQRGIGFIEDDVIPLASIGGDIVIFLDEADQLTPAAQSALKGVIENSPAYFILTCNELNKISPWLQSRCQVRTFQPIEHDDMVLRLRQISDKENLWMGDNEKIKMIADAHKGDLRNAIGAMQTASYMDDNEALIFIRGIGHSDIDAAYILRLAFKERAFAEVMDEVKSVDTLDLIEVLFKYGINSPASNSAKLTLIDAAITSRRDLLMGVEDVYVKHNFVRMLVERQFNKEKPEQ
jgi:DNA polymerase III delta prime subunit